MIDGSKPSSSCVADCHNNPRIVSHNPLTLVFRTSHPSTKPLRAQLGEYVDRQRREERRIARPGRNMIQPKKGEPMSLFFRRDWLMRKGKEVVTKSKVSNNTH